MFKEVENFTNKMKYIYIFKKDSNGNTWNENHNK